MGRFDERLLGTWVCVRESEISVLISGRVGAIAHAFVGGQLLLKLGPRPDDVVRIQYAKFRKGDGKGGKL